MAIEMRDTDLNATHGVFRRSDMATSVLLAGFTADVSAVLDAS
jgi:hypothetical protein